MFVYNPLYHVVGTPYQIFFLGMYSILNFCTIYIVAVNILKEKKKNPVVTLIISMEMVNFY